MKLKLFVFLLSGLLLIFLVIGVYKWWQDRPFQTETIGLKGGSLFFLKPEGSDTTFFQVYGVVNSVAARKIMVATDDGGETEIFLTETTLLQKYQENDGEIRIEKDVNSRWEMLVDQQVGIAGYRDQDKLIALRLVVFPEGVSNRLDLLNMVSLKDND